MKTYRGLLIAWVASLSSVVLTAAIVRVPVLKQIDLPHHYYFRELYLPQLTAGPSSATWTPDGSALIYSMQGSLWRQSLDSEAAEQLTDDPGTDYQPDCAPDGRSVVFVRYDGRSMELMLLDLSSSPYTVRPLTSNGAVNVEPRWSPTGDRIAYVSTAGSGHFLLHVGEFRDGRLTSPKPITPDRRSSVVRYYYSPFDHAINPTWMKDGRELMFVSNREIAHGTGDIVRMKLDAPESPRVVQHEETSWHARPDVSPDGTRMVYSSYLGRQWQQLWLLPVGGGYPFPLTYGDYDNTSPRWSPDSRQIAFVSNRIGNTTLWIVDAFSGAERPIQIAERRYLHPHKELTLRIRDESGATLPARVSVSDGRLHAYAPDEAWIHADDLLVPERQAVETRYFHSLGQSRIAVPVEPLTITVSHGPGYEIATIKDDPSAAGWSAERTVTLRHLPPTGSGEWWSGDLHVHMNYGGTYRNTPRHLFEQATAEDLNLVYNLVVNKEQRFPDIASFRSDPDPVSTKTLVIAHGQEFHTSYWGHLAILNLAKHLLLPGYSAYPLTAVESPYPHNAKVADMAHEQGGLVGYAHPFDENVDPVRDDSLTNELPVDAALGKVDYYEAVGFADPRFTNAVWYQLLECGLRIPAAAGTDAMANYASLRGPVGLNRTYVPASGNLTKEAFLEQVRRGRGVATNGARVQLNIGESGPGDTIQLPAGPQTVHYRATLRANFAVDHLEIVSNGKVATSLATGADHRTADVTGTFSTNGSGWLLLRAWNDAPDPAVLDVYPYATTSPVYVEVGGRPRRSREAASYFLRWLDRIESATGRHPGYRTDAERATVLGDVRRAREYYESCLREAGGSER